MRRGRSPARNCAGPWSRAAENDPVQDQSGDDGETQLTLKQAYDNNASNLLRRSDQWPFLQKGVPAIWFHTGLHPDCHTIYDRPEKIEYAKMERVARLVYQASWDLANANGRP